MSFHYQNQTEQQWARTITKHQMFEEEEAEKKHTVDINIALEIPAFLHAQAN